MIVSMTTIHMQIHISNYQYIMGESYNTASQIYSDNI